MLTHTRVILLSLPIQNKPRMFWFCFYPWPYILNIKTCSRETGDIFSIAAHVFRKLFLKICPLFGQVLIMCLKWVSLMRWGWDWKIAPFTKARLNLFLWITQVHLTLLFHLSPTLGSHVRILHYGPTCMSESNQLY